MKYIEINGNKVSIKPGSSRFTKTAYQISQEIYHNLRRIGITPEYIDLRLPKNPLSRETPAEIQWTVNGQEFYFQCSTQEKYVDNLGVIGNVIASESYAIRNGMKEFGQVMTQFRLGFEEGTPKIRSPREILGIPHNINDLTYIEFLYKKKAKELHPDTQNGDTEKFKEMQQAYQDLKREIENKQ